MRLAIISDSHGNLEAFKEVLADIDQSKVDEIASLGDNIGYGPEPEEVVQLIRKHNIPSVMGNHELAVSDTRYLDWMNPSARQSLVLTRHLLSPDTVDYIDTLRPFMTIHESLCVHGCPPDSITKYLFELSRTQFRELFQGMKEKVCFVGHTHFPQIIVFDGQEVAGLPLQEGVFTLGQEHHYIINVGSVGQPRDGNNNAKYVIWDTTSASIEVRFIPYDIATTARKILELGFPEYNARRLW
ncbi:MAG: metallophosphoesterase family protein [Desulfobacterales bacterium]|nr:MAG: metallophosphoesterase family protein [Desulfobacterales bacterium]